MAAGGRHAADGLLVVALAGGDTHLDAARKAGVSERTVRRRMEDREFRREVELARQELVARAVGRGADALVEAVDVARDLMMTSASELTRLNAAKVLIGFVGARRSDPVTEAIHGATSVTIHEFTRWMADVVQLALMRLDDGSGARFVEDVETLAARRQTV